MLTKREQNIFKEIEDWEQRLLSEQHGNFQSMFDKWLQLSFDKLPDNVQKEFFRVIDDWLFHLQAMIQNTKFQNNAEARILENARLYNPNISDISEMRELEINQLQYIANEQIARHRLYSLFQGSLTGTGKAIFMGADIPAIAIINIRIVQLLSMTYGFKLNNPFAMITALKCFHGGMLPAEWKKDVWSELINNLHNTDNPYIYESNDEIISVASLQQPLQQLLKLIVISLFKNKRIENIPVISMFLGASVNYKLTKDVTEFSHNYYKYRYLFERQGGK